MFCGKCGKENQDGTKFCSACGENLMEAAKAQEEVNLQKETAPPAPAYVAPQQQQQQTPQQQQYQQQAYNVMDQLREPMSVGDYIVTFILLGIPLVNIILLFVWAFGSTVNINKKNLSRAYLIFFAIIVVLWIIGGGIIWGLISSLANQRW